jgi:hypothetical protein
VFDEKGTPLNPGGLRYELALLPRPGARTCVCLCVPIAFACAFLCLFVCWSVRFADEWVRHKALDCVGDLALAGAPLHAHFYGTLCGHELNCQLLDELFADEANYAVLRDSPTTRVS